MTSNYAFLREWKLLSYSEISEHLLALAGFLFPLFQTSSKILYQESPNQRLRICPVLWTHGALIRSLFLYFLIRNNWRYFIESILKWCHSYSPLFNSSPLSFKLLLIVIVSITKVCCMLGFYFILFFSWNTNIIYLKAPAKKFWNFSTANPGDHWSVVPYPSINIFTKLDLSRCCYGNVILSHRFTTPFGGLCFVHYRFPVGPRQGKEIFGRLCIGRFTIELEPA